MLTAAIIGASGYAGQETLDRVLRHPALDLVALGSDSLAGRGASALDVRLNGSVPPFVTNDEAAAAGADVVFCCLGHEAAAELEPPADAIVVDLSGAHRLRDGGLYPDWYGFDHPRRQELGSWSYGLPELRPPAGRLVANPGCYATAAILSAAPVLTAGLAEPDALRVDGKTGVSGAGRTAAESTSFGATEDSIRPYRFPAHQHTPEIERGIELATGLEVRALFVPHLVPAVRGVVTTSYLTAAPGATTDSLTECLRAAYEGRPFVRVLAPGEMVDAKRMRGTNMIELQAVADPCTGTAIVIGAVDNLVKGAAGQAIQNANLLHGIAEDTGLPTVAVYP